MKTRKRNVKFIKVIAANFLFAMWFSKLSGKGQHFLLGLLGSQYIMLSNGKFERCFTWLLVLNEGIQ